MGSCVLRRSEFALLLSQMRPPDALMAQISVDREVPGAARGGRGGD